MPKEIRKDDAANSDEGSTAPPPAGGREHVTDQPDGSAEGSTPPPPAGGRERITNPPPARH